MSVTPKASELERLPRVLGSLGTEDVQTTQGPLWFVTNALCEPAHWDANVFAYYGAEHQERSPYYGGNTPYPLATSEEAFILAGGLPLTHYCTDLLLGYTVWWNNRKWACPTLEYSHESLPEQGEDLELRSFVEREAVRVYQRLRSVQGTVLLDLSSLTDRYILHLLVPMEVVIATFPRPESWHQFLIDLFPLVETGCGV